MRDDAADLRVMRRLDDDLPVIVMTAYPTAETRAQAMAAGALAYFTKPIDPDELLSTLAATVAWPFMPPSD
jgi:DNA-binding NtrC family response regulator